MHNSTLISGCTLYDGSGELPVVRDVRITDGLISGIGAFTPEHGELVINAHGLALMPGIIHMASYLDTLGGVANASLERAYAASGVTTLILGLGGYTSAPHENAQTQDNASSLAPKDLRVGGWKTMRNMIDDLSSREHALNVATFVGAETLLSHASPERALNDALASGAIGCSFRTGDPFVVGTPEYNLARSTAMQGRVNAFRPSYASTLAKEFEHANIFSDTHNATIIADDVSLPAHAAPSTLSAIGSILSSAGSRCYALLRNGVSRYFPSVSFSREHKQLVERLEREELTHEELAMVDTAHEDFLLWIGNGTIAATQKRSSLISRSLSSLADEWNMSPSSALALLQYRHQGGVALTAPSASQSEDFIRDYPTALPRHNYVPLERVWQSAIADHADTEFAQHFLRARTPIDMSRMISKLTDIPASLLGLSKRGRIAKGMNADLVLFNPQCLTPASFSHTIVRVFIHGQCLYEDGSYQRTTAGRVLLAA